MKVIESMQKYNTSDLFIGDVYVATMFGENEGKLDGSYKGREKGEKVVATRNELGDYVSIEDGKIYSSSNPENVIRNAKGETLEMLRHVEGFEKTAAPYAKRKLPKKISRKAAIKYQTIVNSELTKDSTASI